MTDIHSIQSIDLPGADLEIAKMPCGSCCRIIRAVTPRPGANSTSRTTCQSDRQHEIDRALSSVIHVGARPLRSQEWKALLESVGFRVVALGHAPMHLLRPLRLIEDEGLFGALRLVRNLVKDDGARRRVMAMRWVFKRYRQHLSAIYIVAQKDWS